MRHLIKYKFKKQIREWSTLFWALVFPFILGTLFYFSFGSGDMGEDMEPIKVAVVREEGEAPSAQAFETLLNEMDGDTLKLEEMEDAKALKKLKADEVAGIYYVKEEPSLTVAKSSLNQSILKAIMDVYYQNAALIKTIAEEHPENLNIALEQMTKQERVLKEVSVGGRTINPIVSYFFALLAYACISGAFMGVSSSADAQANLSPLGARRSVTPTHKLQLVLTDMFVLLGIQFVNVSMITLYVHFVLGIDLGDTPIALCIINLFGSMIGIAIGMLIGCLSKLSEGVRQGITVLCTLFPAFLAGLMISNIKDVIEHYCPIINRINPVAVLSDAYYCIGVYSDMERFTRNIMILGVMSAVFLIIAFLVARRERYDSI